MPTSIIVHGPAGCGKTRNAAALSRHFDLPKVLDTGRDGVRLNKLPHIAFANTLVLTNDSPELLPPAHRSLFTLIPYDEAARAAGCLPRRAIQRKEKSV